MTRFAIRVQPGAKSDEILGWIADAVGNSVLKLRLRAPALEGKANAALIDLLAESLEIRPRQILIERGGKSREKIIAVEGLTLEEIKRRTN